VTHDKEMERYRKRVTTKRSRRIHNGRRQADGVRCWGWYEVALWIALGAFGAVLIAGCVSHISGSI
jgi:hypothetical protein